MLPQLDNYFLFCPCKFNMKLLKTVSNVEMYLLLFPPPPLPHTQIILIGKDMQIKSSKLSHKKGGEGAQAHI